MQRLPLTRYYYLHSGSGGVSRCSAVSIVSSNRRTLATSNTHTPTANTITATASNSRSDQVRSASSARGVGEGTTRRGSSSSGHSNTSDRSRLYGTLTGLLVFPVSAFTLSTVYDSYFAPYMDNFWAKNDEGEEGYFAAAAAGDDKEGDEEVVGTLDIISPTGGSGSKGPTLGGPFALTSSVTRSRLTDTQLFSDHWTLLYFGFTRCAEICPNTVKWLDDTIREAREGAEPRENRSSSSISSSSNGASSSSSSTSSSPTTPQQQLQLAFISIDSIRDTSDDVIRFLNKHAPYLSRTSSAVGLTGTKEQVKAAAQAWRVYVSSVDETDEERAAREAKTKGNTTSTSSGGGGGDEASPPPPSDLAHYDDSYQLDHSAAIYLVGPDGKLKDFFFKEMGSQHMIEKLGLHFENVYNLN